MCRRTVENVNLGCIMCRLKIGKLISTIIFSFGLHFNSEKKAGFAYFLFLKTCNKLFRNC